MPRDGSVHSAPPTSQPFWTTRASGTTASFDWKITDGSYRLVVMNADGSATVNTHGRVGLTVPHLFAIGLGILIVGLVIAVIGIGLFILAMRLRRASRPTAPLTPAYPATSG
jgi:hypothetical protein